MKSLLALMLMLILMYTASAQKSTRVKSTVKLSTLKETKVQEPVAPVNATYNLDIKSEEDNKFGSISTPSTAIWKGTIYDVYQHEKTGKIFIIVPNTKDTGFHRKYIKTN